LLVNVLNMKLRSSKYKFDTSLHKHNHGETHFKRVKVPIVGAAGLEWMLEHRQCMQRPCSRQLSNVRLSFHSVRIGYRISV
jgi:hypothetical protein